VSVARFDLVALRFARSRNGGPGDRESGVSAHERERELAER
jgi:hypothetical protein